MSTNSKRKKLAYLVGPIESASDHGRGWRKELTSRLAEFDIEVIDPTSDVIICGISDVHERRRIVDSARESRAWEKLTILMDDIWKFNDRAVGESDFLIVHYPEKVSGGGTLREMQKAFDYAKPVYLVYEHDPVSINCHILHMILKRGKIFSSFDELFQFLKAEYGAS